MDRWTFPSMSSHMAAQKCQTAKGFQLFEGTLTGRFNATNESWRRSIGTYENSNQQVDLCDTMLVHKPFGIENFVERSSFWWRVLKVLKGSFVCCWSCQKVSLKLFGRGTNLPDFKGYLQKRFPPFDANSRIRPFTSCKCHSKRNKFHFEAALWLRAFKPQFSLTR